MIYQLANRDTADQADRVLESYFGAAGRDEILEANAASNPELYAEDKTQLRLDVMTDERYAIPDTRLADAQSAHAPVWRSRFDGPISGLPKQIAPSGALPASGCTSAAVSAYWAHGGTALLDTVGGEIEQWSLKGSAEVVVTLWVIVVLKIVGAVAPLGFVGVAAGRLPWTTGRQTRLLGWFAAVALTVYGGLLSLVGLLVQVGVVDAADEADERPLRGTRTSRIPGSRCGAVHSPWPCGAAVCTRPRKPFEPTRRTSRFGGRLPCCSSTMLVSPGATWRCEATSSPLVDGAITRKALPSANISTVCPISRAVTG